MSPCSPSEAMDARGARVAAALGSKPMVCKSATSKAERARALISRSILKVSAAERAISSNGR